jgi:HD-like signal output (HDOD) protein
MQLADIDKELELARAQGPVRDIIIPPCPELLTELQREVRQGDPDPAAIARIAGADVAMAASLIKTSNSSLYARSRTASTVAQAISMLGVGPSVQVLTGFLARNAIRVNAALISHFWETSTRRSLAMGYIARQLYGVDPDIAQTCGLFCHVGIPVMLQGVKGYSGTLAEAMARQDRSFTETENAAHKTDHAVVGAIVARTWRLPPVIAAAVRLHHDFSALKAANIGPEVRTLVASALVAEHLVGLHEGVQVQREWDRYGAECLAYLQVGEGELEGWVDALHPIFESVSLG